MAAQHRRKAIRVFFGGVGIQCPSKCNRLETSPHLHLFLPSLHVTGIGDVASNWRFLKTQTIVSQQATTGWSAPSTLP